MIISIAAFVIAALLIFVLSPMLAALAFYLGGLLLAIVLAVVLVGLGVPLMWWRA